MIDSIEFFIDNKHIPENWFEDFKELTNRQTKYSNTRVTNYGQFGNFRVIQNIRGVYISGSIAKYYLGTNQKTLQQSDLTNAFAKLAAETNLHIYKARVNRLDLAENIITNQPVGLYYQHWGTHKYLKNRIEVKNGLYFKNESRCVLIYDKTREVFDKKAESPLMISKQNNCMRIEYRFMKHQVLSRALGLSEVTVEDIIICYTDLVNMWFNTIQAIGKIKPQTTLSMDVLRNKDDFDKQIMILGMKAIGGFNALKKMVDTARKALVFKYPNQATNLLNKYRRLVETTDLKEAQPLIEEIQQKLRIALFVHSRPSIPLLG